MWKPPFAGSDKSPGGSNWIIFIFMVICVLGIVAYVYTQWINN